MSDLTITHAGTQQTSTTQGPMNPVSAFGQAGSVFTDGTGAITPPTGKVFVAITFLDDAVLAATTGLVAEDSTKYINTAEGAHNLSVGSEKPTEGGGGTIVDAGNTFPKGVTIYGRWTKITLNAASPIIAYIG